MHDALYQFLPCGVPLSRAEADRCFLMLMGESRFRLRHLYYAAVRLFGWVILRLTRRIRTTHGGRRVDLTEAALESGGPAGGP